MRGLLHGGAEAKGAGRESDRTLEDLGRCTSTGQTGGKPAAGVSLELDRVSCNQVRVLTLGPHMHVSSCMYE